MITSIRPLTLELFNNELIQTFSDFLLNTRNTPKGIYKYSKNPIITYNTHTKYINLITSEYTRNNVFSFEDNNLRNIDYRNSNNYTIIEKGELSTAYSGSLFVVTFNSIGLKVLLNRLNSGYVNSYESIYEDIRKFVIKHYLNNIKLILD